MTGRHTIRVGTMNVRTLTGRIGAVAALATEMGINILAMQETRLASDATRSSHAAFRAAGWTLHQGTQGRDGRGVVTAGVACISDIPAQMIDIARALAHDGRVMALKVGRHGLRPLIVVNIYLPAGDKVPGNAIAIDAIQWAGSTDKEFILMSDWNRPEDSYPLAGLLSKGSVWTMDGDQLARHGTFLDGTTHHAHRIWVAFARLLWMTCNTWVSRTTPCHLHAQGTPGGGDWRWQRTGFRKLWSSDLDRAWQLLSQVAEDAMACRTGGQHFLWSQQAS